jgi:signal transduction histidine kinase
MSSTHERLAAVVLALRWATVATGVVLSLAGLLDHPGTIAATLALVGHSLWRTFRPLPPPGATDTEPRALALDVGLGLGAVAASGGWDSPYVFTLLVGVLVAGSARGYRGGLVSAAAASAVLGLAAAVVPSARAGLPTASQVILVYVTTAVVAGFSRRLFLEAEERQEAFTDRMTRLTEANELLSQLARVTQTLPSSLDLGDTLAAAMGHLRQLFDFTGATILVLNPAMDTWRAKVTAGFAPPALLHTEDLPSPARTALTRSVVVCEPALDPGGTRSGLWGGSRSGLYAPLLARHRVVALVVLEHDEADRFGPQGAALMTGLAETMALAIDNALWFERLRTLGAEGERDRLARNLHDRIGQGLAYVGLELDRISRLPEHGAELTRLRVDVGDLLGEVRETLRQLRARVTETAGLAVLADAYLPRFADRTGIIARFSDATGGTRLPVPVEQELWRILQEALSNVEQHSGAGAVEVEWMVKGSRGRLQVSDDGRGFDPETLADVTSSGLMAMRERANAIGARLSIDSQPPNGTCLVAEVEVGVHG